MCLIEADGDDSDVDIDIMQRFFENVHFDKNMFINGIFHCCSVRPPFEVNKKKKNIRPVFYQRKYGTVYTSTNGNNFWIICKSLLASKPSVSEEPIFLVEKC